MYTHTKKVYRLLYPGGAFAILAEEAYWAVWYFGGVYANIRLAKKG